MDIASVQSRLRSALEGTTCHGPVPEEQIAAAEKQLEVSFPPSLRTFLSEYGAAFGGGLDLAGLPVCDGEPPAWSDLVETTLRIRRRAMGNLPGTLILISDDGMDCRYFVDVGTPGTDGECPVVALGPGREYEKVAESFVDFVEKASRGERL